MARRSARAAMLGAAACFGSRRNVLMLGRQVHRSSRLERLHCPRHVHGAVSCSMLPACAESGEHVASRGSLVDSCARRAPRAQGTGCGDGTEDGAVSRTPITPARHEGACTASPARWLEVERFPVGAVASALPGVTPSACAFETGVGGHTAVAAQLRAHSCSRTRHAQPAGGWKADEPIV